MVKSGGEGLLYPHACESSSSCLGDIVRKKPEHKNISKCLKIGSKSHQSIQNQGPHRDVLPQSRKERCFPGIRVSEAHFSSLPGNFGPKMRARYTLKTIMNNFFSFLSDDSSILATAPPSIAPRTSKKSALRMLVSWHGTWREREDTMDMASKRLCLIFMFD